MFPTEEDMNDLSKSCTKLESFKITILRTSSFGSVEWRKESGKWTGGIIEGTAESLPANAPMPEQFARQIEEVQAGGS